MKNTGSEIKNLLTGKTATTEELKGDMERMGKLKVSDIQDIIGKTVIGVSMSSESVAMVLKDDSDLEYDAIIRVIDGKLTQFVSEGHTEDEFK